MLSKQHDTICCYIASFLDQGFIPGNVGWMDAIVRCGRCLAGGRGCLLKGPHLIPSLKFRLPYLINVHQSINPFLLKSRGMKYCPSGKTPTYECLWQFKLQFYHDLCYVNHIHLFLCSLYTVKH